MAHGAREASVQSGEPVELYRFWRGLKSWRYTSSASAVYFNEEWYDPAVISRSGVEYTSEEGRSNIKITCPRDLPVADLYRIYPPSDVVQAAVYRVHAGESLGAVIWMGRVVGARWTGAKAEITCEPVANAMARTGLRRLYQRSCPHVLYGPDCGLNKTSYAVSVTLSEIAPVAGGVALKSSGFDSTGYAGGFVEWTDTDLNVERRYISDVVTGGVVVPAAIPGVAVGSTLTFYRGCGHNIAGCKTFGNVPNYGGFPYIPAKNPFDGSSLY